MFEPLDTKVWLHMLGRPYAPLGRGPEAYDCLGVVLEGHRRMGYPVPDPVTYDPAKPGDAFATHWADGWERIQVPRPGCGVLFRLLDPRWPDHCGLVISEDEFLHVTADHRVIVADLAKMRRNGRVAGFFWPKMTAQDGYHLPSVATLADIAPAPPGIPVAVGGAILGLSAEAAAVSAGAIAITAGLNIIAGTLVSLLANMIAAPKARGSDKPEEGSPTFSLSGARNTGHNGAMIPIVYGTHRVAGVILQRFYRVTADFKSVLYVLVGVSEGPIKSIGGIAQDSDYIPSSAIAGSKIEIDGNPISGFPTAKVHVRLGASRQSVIPGFEDTITAVEQNITLRRSLSFSVPSAPAIVAENDQTWSYTTSEAVDGFEIIIRFPQGLYKVNGDGDTQAYSFAATLRYKRVDAPSSEVTEILYFGPSTVRADHARAVVKRSLTRGLYRMSITRVTSNDDETERRFSTSIIQAVNEINSDQAVAYNTVALLGITDIYAEQTGGSIPEVTSLVEGREVWIWDGVSETSPAFTKAYSSNPAWCSLDLALNDRFGGGAMISLDDIDLSALKDWADYCDASLVTSGTTHARWSLNYVIDQLTNVGDILDLFAAAGRASFVEADRYTWKIQKARTPRQLFCDGDIVPGSFRMHYLDTFKRPNLVRVAYRNKRLDYDQDWAQPVPYARNDGRIVPENMELRGITMPEQAYRAAMFFRNVSQYVTKRLTLSVPVDSLDLEAGDPFYFQHDVVDKDRAFGGRVVTNSSGPSDGIHIDRDITVPASPTWKIMVQSYASDSGTISLAVMTPTPGTYSAGDNIPIAETWSSTALPKLGDLYTIGPSTTYYTTWDAVHVSRDDELNATIEAVTYNEAIYSDDPGEIEAFTQEWPHRRKIPTNPSNLAAYENTRRLADGTIGHRLDISWSPAGENESRDPTDDRDAHVSRDGHPHDVWIRGLENEGGAGDATEFDGITSWRYCGRTTKAQFEIDEGLSLRRPYEISVTPASWNGNRMAPEYGAHTVAVILGKVEAPTAPSNLLAYSRDERGFMKFDPASDLDIRHHEVRSVSLDHIPAAWWFASRLGCFLCDMPEFEGLSQGNERTLLVKAVNASGVSSIIPASVAFTPGKGSHIARIASAEAPTWTGTKTNCAVTGTYLRTTLSQASSQYTSTNHNILGYSLILQILPDIVAMELDTTGAEAGYLGNSPHAQRLLGNGALLDHPDPSTRLTGEQCGFTGNSPMAVTIRGDESQDWDTLHDVLVEYDLATDDPPTVWDGWKEYVAPIYVRNKTYVRVRFTFTNAAAGRYQTDLRYLLIYGINVPIFEAGTVTMTGSSPRTLTYANGPYPSAPFVLAQPVSENSGWKVLQTSPGTTSVTLQVVDANGEAVSGASIKYIVAYH